MNRMIYSICILLICVVLNSVQSQYVQNPTTQSKVFVKSFKYGYQVGKYVDRKYRISDDVSDRMFKYFYPNDARSRGTAIYKQNNKTYTGSYVPKTNW
jgi:hypothetical protein